MPSVAPPLPGYLPLHLVTLAHAGLALWVTAHALLTKRDVRAAIAWIGLAWLSPFIGPALYFLFGINRVTRRAARLAPGVARHERFATAPASLPPLPEHIAAIARVGERMSGRHLTAGNAVALYRDGDEAYPAMLAAIAGARRSIALASYIFRDDLVGGAFIRALGDAHARGVEIRVLLDGVGSGYLASSAARALRREGIAVARFMHHWAPWRMPFLNMRNHKKLLIVDGAVGFTGGLNLGAENVLRLRPSHPVEDVQFRIEGPVVALLMLSFDEDWDFTTGEALDGPAWWPPLAAAGPVCARGLSSGPDEDLGKLASLLATAAGAAKRRLRIVTPYFLPDQTLMSAIALAALRGVAVEIVLPERSNHVLLDWATRAHLGFFAGPGMTVHLTGAPFDHSKLTTVDGAWCALGSANWDVRSLRLNFEFMLECYDPGMTDEIDGLIDAKIARARRLAPAELAARPLPARLRDAAARLLLPYL